MRKTLRLDELKIKQLQSLINEDDTAKIVDFALDWTLHNIKFVTSALIGAEWEVIFQRKRKTMELKRRIYQ